MNGAPVVAFHTRHAPTRVDSGNTTRGDTEMNGQRDSYWLCDRAVTSLNSQGEEEYVVWAAEGEDYPVLIGKFARYEDAERIVALHNAGREKPTLPADDPSDAASVQPALFEMDTPKARVRYE